MSISRDNFPSVWVPIVCGGLKIPLIWISGKSNGAVSEKRGGIYFEAGSILDGFIGRYGVMISLKKGFFI